MIIVVVSILIYMMLGWFLSLVTDKYSWIDFFWSSAFIVSIGVIFLSESEIISSGGLILYGIFFMYGVWSMRLSFILFTRIRSKPEDSRYVTMRQSLGSKMSFVMFALYIFEGLLVLALMLPVYFLIENPDPKFTILNSIGTIIFIFALFGETLADRQLEKFKRESSGQKLVCDIGLWKYSRHPNYFFELLIWFAIGVYSVQSANAYVYFIPFAIMTIFICGITGIPPSERQSLLSRGDAYREYQRKTSILIPWFPGKV